MRTFDFFGVKIAEANLTSSLDLIKKHDFTKANYISFPDAYVIALCQHNIHLRSILNNSLITMPDGKPSALMGRRKGLERIEPVSGYWLCRALLDTPLSHYFLGSTPERLQKLKLKIKELHPGAQIKGFSSPRLLTELEASSGPVLREEFEKINALKPDLIWVGISSPKQDYIIHHHLPLLQQGIMLGVGGVFDYLSGEVNKSPEWIKKMGMRWAWRLLSEPGRLWRKYLFVFRILSLRFFIAYLKA